MRQIVTLVSTASTLDGDVLRRVADVLPDPQETVWLDQHSAADIAFHAVGHEDCDRRVRAALGGAPVDFFIQPAAARRKKLLIADMDSTVIGQECLDELADFVGLKPRVAAITARAMRGEIAFVPALRARVAMLEGLDAAIIDEIVAKRITPTPGAKTLVRTMRAHGAYTVLVSGGFKAFTGRIAPAIGFDAHEANVLDIAGGRLTGRVREPVLDSAAKRAALERFCRMRDIPHALSLAVGDGANDLDMLKCAGLGVAFHAKPMVAAAAHACIEHGDLTALLFAQGYRRADFAD